MTALVQIVLVGGPLDGETHPIPEAEARSGRERRYVPPYNPVLAVSMYVPPGEVVIPEQPRRLTYRPLMVDFADWPMPSVTDDGTMRYEYVGEW